MTISDDNEDEDQILTYLGFEQYKPPPLLTRHPPPALGRDDDIHKLKEVLDDVLIKSDNNHHQTHKILFGPDHKIASNLLKLQEMNRKYHVFLPEFPLLHLRKSVKGRQEKEQKRQKFVQREAKKIDCLGSEMHACQAIVKPDCSKPKVQKSTGIKNALNNLLMKSVQKVDSSEGKDIVKVLQDNNLVYTSYKSLPDAFADTVAVATVEFAGVKFKTRSTSGMQYLKFVENAVIMNTKHQFLNMNQIAICEEKYHFTPDDFKAATRSQRKQKGPATKMHLKTSEEILTTDKFNKKTIVTTNEGKQLVSTYLARNIKKLKIPGALPVDIDSEHLMSQCNCERHHCSCGIYTNPIRATFKPNVPDPEVTVLENIQQTKGEAEITQINWLIEYSNILQPHQSCVSIVTSGDIDSVVLHLFALSYLWPRCEDDYRNFMNDVLVILQKPGKINDIYNITAIIKLLETAWEDRFIGQKVALALSLGGHDYLPKFHGISHSSIMDMFLGHECFRQDMFVFHHTNVELQIQFNIEMYKNFIKALYCPKTLTFMDVSFEEVRQISVQPITGNAKTEFRNPQSWMPPESAIEQLGKNIVCLINYYQTVGSHSSPLSDFLKDGCLTKMPDGQIEYDLGPDAHLDNIEQCFVTNLAEIRKKMKTQRSKKRKPDQTPQKCRRRKIKPVTSTPSKTSAVTQELP